MSDSLPPAAPYVPRTRAVVVKFHDDVPLPYEDGAERHLRRLGIGAWDGLARDFPGITLRRAYASVTPERLRELVETAVRRTPSYRPYGFLSVFRVECPAGVDADALARALAAWPDVEEAQVELPVAAAGVNEAPNFFIGQQTYLKPAPLGIDAFHAWTVPGGDGVGQRGADVEYGWMLDHEDLAGQPVSLVHGKVDSDPGNVSHGTGAVGIVCARDNELGGCGIVPNVGSFLLVSRVAADGSGNVPTADVIIAAVSHLNPATEPGAVLLLELASGNNAGFPLEVQAQPREAIRLATAAGVVVIEPAGNEPHDLDLLPDAAGHFLLNPNSADFFDSGAIVVGAALDKPEHPRAPWSGFGNRVDCFAQGEYIFTCQRYEAGALDYQRYTYEYDGTSGAGAIVAGAALSIQGMAQARLGQRLSPAAMRALLRNPLLTTPSAGGAADRIGRMPNLKAIEGALKPPMVELLTPTVTFLTLFEGQPAWNAATFEVTSVEPFTATFQVDSPVVPPFGLTVFGVTAQATSTGAEPARARLWFSLAAPPGLTGPVPPFPVTIRHVETGETFTVQLVHQFIASPFLATALVLDRSGSMLEPAGKTGLKKIGALQQAASTFAALNPYTVDVYPGNQLALVGFSSDAETLLPATVLDDASVPGQIASSLLEVQADPKGKTAIGRGLQEANAILGSLPASEVEYRRAILVFTDGRENVEPKIAEVLGELDPSTHVYAVGLGTPAQVSTEALAELAAATGGYCLLTGELLPDTEDFFRLSKYFLQVLYDLVAEEVSTDPDGVLMPGQSVRVPFVVTEADVRAQVVLLADVPVVELEVETPSGTVLDPGTPGVSWGKGPFARFCRIVLPQGTAHVGTWHARLRVPSQVEDAPGDVPLELLRRARAQGVRYSVSATVRSALRMEGAVSRGVFRPGEPLRARVSLSEYGLPVGGRATVHARVRRPGGSAVTMPLDETEPGVFELAHPAALPGAYEVRLLASGQTFGGNRFTRERLLTGVVLERSPAALPAPPSEGGAGDDCCRQNQRLLLVLVLLGVVGIALLLLLIVVVLLTG